MTLAPSERLIRLDAHDDGVNRWEMARLRPSLALTGDVHSYSDYWERTGGFTTRREMPGIDPVLIVNLGDPIEIVGGDGLEIRVAAGEGFVAATHVRHALSRSGGAQAGVHVHMPLATLQRLLRMPLGEMLDRTVKLDTLAGGWGRDLAASLADAGSAAERADVLDRHLRDRLDEAPEPDSEIGHAVAALTCNPGTSVEALAQELGWSRKRLALRFREATGVGPRMFRRLVRFGRLTARLQQGSTAGWAELALDAGYFDQPHMIRDFRDFAGVSPRSYLARSLPNMGGIVEQ